MVKRLHQIAAVIGASVLSVLAPAANAGGPSVPTAVVVHVGGTLRSFSGQGALGATLDGHGAGETPQIYSPANIAAMRSSGLGPISYRLRTELGVEAWHWNRAGHWSDARCRCGYWTSSSRPSRGAAPLATYGYQLPRRGDTVDQANDNGYSRLDDGSRATFWKSNPYLDPHYTHESHPQWVLIDFRRPRAIDALRVSWGTPYATRFAIERWIGPSAVVLNNHPPGHWRPFPRASFTGHGGLQTLRLASHAVRARFVRILLTRSSHTAPPGSHDIRDRLGYAIREIYVGALDASGTRFTDFVHHHPSGAQTVTYSSSTDPWHRASDIDRNVEQPSFETIIRSRLGAGAPLLVPVAVLYGTPSDAANELRYLRALGVPLRGVELGEEPDGQLAAPEDYGTLYLQFAAAINAAVPGLKLGGPSLQTSIPDWYAWPDRAGNRSWVARFLSYLRARGRLGALSFFSFEWYPFDDTCLPPAAQLAREARLLARTVAEQRAHGLPSTVPMILSEYGYSAFAGRPEVDIDGALLNAEVAAQFLALGGETSYAYGLEPDTLISERARCNTWGNLALLLSNDVHRIRFPLPTYWAARMLAGDWLDPRGGPHQLLASSVTPAGGGLESYAVRRPDGRVAVLLLNLDPGRAYRAHVEIGAPRVAVSQYSRLDYVWHARGPHGTARPRQPPSHLTQDGEDVLVPPYSITVVSGPP